MGLYAPLCLFHRGKSRGYWQLNADAQRSYNAGENILGVLNLDMIAWNTLNSSPDIDLHAKQTIPATLTLAQLFADVITTYNLNLIPQIIPNGTVSSPPLSLLAIWLPGDFGD